MIVWVMEALKTIRCDLHILACPRDCAAAFEPLTQEVGFEIVAGSKDDVLKRYGTAIRQFRVDRVIRATGDNPFVFADAALTLHQEACKLDADYAGYAGLPYGAGVESVSAKALLRAEAEASMVSEREHVCPYLYNNPHLFKLHRPLAPLTWQAPNIRVTVDTQEDYERAEALCTPLSAIDSEIRYHAETIIKTALHIFGSNE
jgi:spore coat polysaccharide biosynthesis protein SpsF